MFSVKEKDGDFFQNATMSTTDDDDFVEKKERNFIFAVCLAVIAGT